jgi:iron complex outermembrane receptor protein
MPQAMRCGRRGSRCARSAFTSSSMTSPVPRASARPAAARAASPAFSFSLLTLACLSAHAQVATLPPVTVTASRFAEEADRLPFGVSVVTAQQIRDAGATTVNEALMKLLGVPGRLDLYGGGDYSLDLRGFGSAADGNQVVILDGVRLNESDLGGTRLAGIPIDDVDTIEVIRGSAAVLYGEGGTAGAIVITTKAAKGKLQRSSGRAYLAMGSDALLDARGGATLVNGGFSLDASLNKRSSNGHRANFRSSTEGHALTGQWRGEWLRVGARHSQDELATGLPGSLTNDEYAADPSQASSMTDRASVENLRNGVFAEASLGNWQIAVDAGQRDKSLDSISGFPYAYHIEARNRALRVRHSTPAGAVTNTFTAGVDRSDWTRVESFGVTAEHESQGVYLKNDLGLPSGTRLSVGARRDSIAKASTGAPGAGVDTHFNAWDVGVVQAFGKGVSAYARGGRSFRFANVDEFGYVSPGTTLRPQTSRDIDAGLRVDWRAGRGELRVYRNALRDEIGFNPDAPAPFGGTGANVNFDPTLRQGVELELQQALHKTVQLRLNTAARQARFTEGPYDGKKVASTPRYAASVGVDWQPLAGHKLNAMLNSVSSQPVDFNNTCTMPAHTTADLRYAFGTDHVELALGVSNLTDRKYFTLAYRCTPGGEPTAIYPEAGRRVMLSLRVTL